MKWFIIGALTPVAVYAITFFAALGWKHGRGNRVTNVNVNMIKEQP